MKLAYLIIFVFSSCSIFSNDEIEFKLELNKTTFSKTDTIKAEFIITNKTDEDKIFRFNYGCQFYLDIKSDTQSLRDGYSCPAILSSLEVKSGKSAKINYELKINSFKEKLNNNNSYTLEGYLLNGNSPKRIKKITIL